MILFISYCDLLYIIPNWYFDEFLDQLGLLVAGTVPWLLGLLVVVVVVGMVVVEVVLVVLSVEVAVLLIVAGSHSILSINLPQYKENFHLFGSISFGQFASPASAVKTVLSCVWISSFQ